MTQPSILLTNTRVECFEPLTPPASVCRKIPRSAEAAKTVAAGRQALADALAGKDSRFVIVTGPCSIHDPKAAFEYASRLNVISNRVAEKILLIMRVYFEKPRTTVGWKGLISDPDLNGSNDIARGLGLARDILLQINEMGMPAASEFLDPIVPQYTSDLVSWAAIGARTTESQTHRQMASGLSMPVGFKNATDGGLQVAIDAMESARHKHAFVGIDDEGRTSVVRTTGNPDVHIVLRGGAEKPNYFPEDVSATRRLLKSVGTRREIMIDCSHGNSSKDFRKQPDVFQQVVDQYAAGDRSILGVMLESHLHEGKQSLDSVPLKYGVSVTDGCIGWQDTESLILDAFAKLP